MKKEFSRFVIPNINMERKRMAKETQIIQYKIDDKCLNIGNGKYYHIKTQLCIS